MFENARSYLIVQFVVGVVLMLGVISNLVGWSTSQRWIGAILLWWHIINWSGILEAKPWLWASENLRVIVTAFALIVMNSLFEPSAALFALLAVSAYSILWTNLYFRPGSSRLVPA